MTIWLIQIKAILTKFPKNELHRVRRCHFGYSCNERDWNMKRCLVAILATALAGASPGLASGDLTRTDIIDVKLEMGSSDGGMYFKPNHFEFETGRAYKLVMINVDEIKHEVSLNEMAQKIFTRKVEVRDTSGKFIAEIKGSIHEVEIAPGQTVEWFFVPIQTLDKFEITCEIPGHLEAGMHASATIK